MGRRENKTIYCMLLAAMVIFTSLLSSCKALSYEASEGRPVFAVRALGMGKAATRAQKEGLRLRLCEVIQGVDESLSIGPDEVYFFARKAREKSASSSLRLRAIRANSRKAAAFIKP